MGQISIHAPRVGCDDWNVIRIKPYQDISIHAPRVGCDQKKYADAVGQVKFQSTHPVWGATAENA